MHWYLSELVQLYSRFDSNANVRIPGPYILVWVTGKNTAMGCVNVPTSNLILTLVSTLFLTLALTLT